MSEVAQAEVQVSEKKLLPAFCSVFSSAASAFTVFMLVKLAPAYSG